MTEPPGRAVYRQRCTEPSVIGWTVRLARVATLGRFAFAGLAARIIREAGKAAFEELLGVLFTIALTRVPVMEGPAFDAQGTEELLNVERQVVEFGTPLPLNENQENDRRRRDAGPIEQWIHNVQKCLFLCPYSVNGTQLNWRPAERKPRSARSSHPHVLQI